MRYVKPEQVVRQLRARHLAGLSVRLSDVQVENSSFVRAVYRFFSGWNVALKMAGVPVSEDQAKPGVRSRYPTRESVKSELRRRRDAGLSLASTTMVGLQGDVALYRAARKWFGKWQDALKAAGVVLVRKKRTSRAHS